MEADGGGEGAPRDGIFWIRALLSRLRIVGIFRKGHITLTTIGNVQECNLSKALVFSQGESFHFITLI